jgi:hypothetical protein
MRAAPLCADAAPTAAGIPLAFLYVLRRARVPELAVWKRDCAWLRAIVQRSLVLGAKETMCEVDTLTTESVTMEQLRAMHALFIVAPTKEQVPLMQPPPSNKPRPSSKTTRLKASTARFGASPDGQVEGGAAKVLLRVARRALALTRHARDVLVALWRSGTKLAQRSVSRMLWTGERELLLKQLLDWAATDEGSGIGEPRDNALHWRTEHDWDGLRAEGALLGPRDAAERDAFLNLRFLFAGFSPRAWYW